MANSVRGGGRKVKPPFGRPGGKKHLVKRLLDRVPEHKIYVEPFAGAASLLFAKAPSQWEILNDTDGEVLNFFRVAKHRPAELAELLEIECVHAGRFYGLRDSHVPEDELRRALRFAYLTWFSFGAKQQHFGSIRPGDTSSKPVRRSLVEVRALLENVALRLYRVLIEQRDFAVCIRRWDSPATFFYVDPPYIGSRGQDAVYAELPPRRQQELARMLRRVRGQWLLSINDCAVARSLYRGLRFERVAVRQTLQLGSNSAMRRELLIRNF